jgi:hypothetical protein
MPSAVRLLLWSLLLLAPKASWAQEPADATVARLHGRASQFLETVADGEPQSALEDLLQGSQLRKQAQGLQDVIQKSKDLESRYGKFKAVERISAKRVGKDLVLLKYLYKCENYPVVWYLTFYRDFSRPATAEVEENWILIGLRFDTELEGL